MTPSFTEYILVCLCSVCHCSPFVGVIFHSLSRYIKANTVDAQDTGSFEICIERSFVQNESSLMDKKLSRASLFAQVPASDKLRVVSSKELDNHF